MKSSTGLKPVAVRLVAETTPQVTDKPKPNWLLAAQTGAPQSRLRGQRQHWNVFRHEEERDIARRIAGDELGLQPAPVMSLHGDLGRAIDDMQSGGQEAVGQHRDRRSLRRAARRCPGLTAEPVARPKRYDGYDGRERALFESDDGRRSHAYHAAGQEDQGGYPHASNLVWAISPTGPVRGPGFHTASPHRQPFEESLSHGRPVPFTAVDFPGTLDPRAPSRRPAEPDSIAHHSACDSLRRPLHGIIWSPIAWKANRAPAGGNRRCLVYEGAP